MNEKKLYEAIGDVDDELLSKTEKKPESKLRWVKWASAAAAVCILSAGAVFLVKNINGGEPPVIGTETAITTEAPFMEEIVSSTTGMGDDSPEELLNNRIKPDNGIISDVVATEIRGDYVSQNTSFRLILKKDIDEEELRKRIGTYPAADFTITREDDKSYLLSVKEELPEDTVVRVEVSDDNGNPCDSWAFQTTEPFKIKSVYPENGASNVYADSGIEIEFSAPPSEKDISDYILVAPEFEYKTTTHRNRLYIVPDEEIESAATYSVTVKKGFPAADGQTLPEDYTFSFKTSKTHDGDYFYTNYGLSETFLEGDPAVVEIYCSENLMSKPFDVSLYRINSADEYKKELISHTSTNNTERYYTDVSVLDKVYSAQEKPSEGLSPWRTLYFMLPDNLTEGYYVTDMSVGELRCQYFIQVSPISVYTLLLGEENLFFVNDTKTGNAAEGAEISFTLNGETVSGTVAADGTARIVTESYGEGILDISCSDMRYIDIFSNRKIEEIGYDDLYYMYIYTDREAYLPTDKIQAWGVIRPRRSDAPVPKDLKLVLGSETSGQSKEITLGEDGSFSAEFSFSNYSERYWLRLNLMSGDEVMCEKAVQVSDYVKPTYSVNVSIPEYAVMPQRDPITAEVTAQYFEGTPAKDLLFTSSAKATPEVIKTNADGYASAEVLFDDCEYWQPRRERLGMELIGIENEYTWDYDNVTSFYRDVMLETKYDKDSRNLTIYTNKMNFDNIEAYMLQDDLYDYGILKGKAYDTEVKIEIVHNWWEAVETGSYYDFIEKKTQKTYEYNYRNDVVGTYSLTTNNGVGVLKNLPTDSDYGYYSVEISYKDSHGQHTIETTSISNKGIEPWGEQSLNRLIFDFDYYNGNDEETYYFSEGDVIDVRLGCNHEFENEDKGKILFVSYQNDIIHYDVYEGTDFKYAPSLDCLPNFVAQGAYFDGRHIYPIYSEYMYFQPSERNIKLTASTDKETYDAGETVSMTVTAKDMDGKPVEGATVMLSVVDEAAFAIAEQNVDILGDLYKTIWYRTAYDYYSYIQHVLDATGDGEKGGGGDGCVRKEFKDNAYFGSLITDGEGKAEFVFKLPDNLTTWRATVQSIKNLETGRILAGDLKAPVISTRPVFVTPIMTSAFVEGDDISVTAKADGIDPDDYITVTVKGENIDKTMSVLSSETANFGKLPKGEYTVLFTAENNGNSDAVQLPLTVTDTILETDISKAADLTDGFTINPISWPVDITFFDKEYMFITEILHNFGRVGGKNILTRVGGAYADKELGYITEEEFINLFKSESSGGFVRPLPAAEGDLKVTAMLCASVPEIIDRNAVIRELEAIISDRNSDKADVCTAYLALSGLGEPVLTEVRGLLESGQITDYYQKMYLVTALALCGDYRTAYDYYCEFVPETEVYDEDGEIAAYVKSPNASEQKEYTKTALMAASVLKLKEADYFARGLMDDSFNIQYESLVPEIIIYLKNYVPDVKGEAVFTYKLNGETKTVTLDRHRGYSMHMGEEQWKNADFKVTSGAVYSIVSYIGRKTELETENKLKVTKTFSGDFVPGELITVTIQAPAYCNVDDVIPSCGRYVEEEGDACYNRSGQKVSLYTDKYGKAVYFFRVVSEGEYVVESAVAQDCQSWGESGRDTITVRKDETA